ncbi:phthiocerol/phthiodiolone dimycocerosyl transferase family protein [Nocardia testacea]|uniref:phthiocerol/phthiodiolone dimycocerosyl transferase family protein n=1 Tax=Nocardia testacea TaxID=248551 RepID=UPI0033E3F93E
MAETRPLGEKEQLLNHLHARGGLIAMLVLHVRGRLDPALVRQALAWLQTQHPILRAHIRYGEIIWRRLPPFARRRPWFDTDGTTEIPLRVLDDPDPDAWQKVMASDIRTPIPKGNHPRLRITLVRQSPDADLEHIVICADHATLDARSAHMFARQLLEFLADPAGSLSKPPVRGALPPPLEAGPPHRSGTGKTPTYIPAIRLPVRPVPDRRKETRVLARHLGSTATAALEDAVKSNRTTLHGAVTAAFLLAVRERYRLDAMTVLTTVDLRRLGSLALPPETYGCYVDILRTEHSITDDFWATARDASFKLIAALAKDPAAASIMKFPEWEVYRREVRPTIRSNGRVDGLAVTTVGESGLRADYGAFTLEDVTRAVSLDMFGPSLFVIANQWLGGLDLSVGYAATAMSDDEVRWLTDNAMARLGSAG